MEEAEINRVVQVTTADLIFDPTASFFSFVSLLTQLLLFLRCSLFRPVDSCWGRPEGEQDRCRQHGHPDRETEAAGWGGWRWRSYRTAVRAGDLSQVSLTKTYAARISEDIWPFQTGFLDLQSLKSVCQLSSLVETYLDVSGALKNTNLRLELHNELVN